MLCEVTSRRKSSISFLQWWKFDIFDMRKEVGFYYGSMMKMLDETEIKLSSEIKQFTAVQKQHQHVLEYLNEEQ